MAEIGKFAGWDPTLGMEDRVLSDLEAKVEGKGEQKWEVGYTFGRVASFTFLLVSSVCGPAPKNEELVTLSHGRLDHNDMQRLCLNAKGIEDGCHQNVIAVLMIGDTQNRC
jgi:hypothetical protein